ncbi:SDR family oxidoreductase [Robertmurraya yapensis]|uniref:SDR family oxidoreductase n=1 Tax=Bacillus yapensis TaxID=2492960 RepID=A0A3S0IKD8_9BACI|nr:glucose 1-dehydrogenase [Bacillus yapensis]RTR36143.1 SDR family oxidoreductase [Bacillus yapensis]TKT05646.1 SDR family oxidoreductase [Bacillus yapensis]
MNKVVIVTGAANGIGRGIALAYAEKGAKVVLADINEEKGKELERQLNAKFVRTDVRSEEDIQNLMKTTINKYGTIDILINNAGISKFKNVYDLSLTEWDDVLNTNLRSVFICSKEAAKYMRQNANGGAIVNIASTRAIMSEPNSEAYAASKGGIVAITHALAASLSEDRITVNAISPGWIETGDYGQLSERDHAQHFSKRVGKPEDIARGCMYLTENDFVTGENLVIDGGMTRKMIYEE